MATDELPDGLPEQQHAVVFGLYPGDPTFYTVVERAPESGGAPGTPVTVAWLAPGTRYYVERRNATDTFSYYRFRHGGFGYQQGTPTAWYRARPTAWNGELPNVPREALLDLDLVLDDSDGTVDLVANGARPVASVVYDAGTTDFASLSPATSADTDANGDVTVSDVLTLGEPQTGYVTVQFFDQVSGGGNLLGTLRQSVTRPVGVGQGGALVLNGDFEHDTDGAYWSGLGSNVSIESTSPISGSKSLKIVSDAATGKFTNQVTLSSGFGSGVAANRRYIPVEPGETFELRCVGHGYSDNPIQLRAATYDADKTQIANPVVVGFNSTGVSAIVSWSVPTGVRYINWQVLVPTDASAPRDYLFDNLTARRIDSTVTGIPTELSLGGTYYIDESQIVPDSSGGAEGSDPGHVYWGANAWKYWHPNGDKNVVAANSVTFVSLDGTRANSAEIMCWVATNSARFTALADTAMRRIVGVRKSRSAGWQYLGDSGWVSFTPNARDALMAEPKFTAEVA